MSKISPYAVICNDKCGQALISQEEYDRQMDKPDSFWQCPLCKGSAEWDDAHFEKHMMEEA